MAASPWALTALKLGGGAYLVWLGIQVWRAPPVGVDLPQEGKARSGASLAAECSVVVARGADGAMVHLPPQRNLHRDGILAVTEVFEGVLSPERAAQAVAATESIARGIDYVGVLCVEFFVLQDGSLVVNEMAPRPHNSGHYTIDACITSQFAQQVRAMAKLPLGDARQHSPAVMLNILGERVLGLPAEPDDSTGKPWSETMRTQAKAVR